MGFFEVFFGSIDCFGGRANIYISIANLDAWFNGNFRVFFIGTSAVSGICDINIASSCINIDIMTSYNICGGNVGIFLRIKVNIIASGKIAGNIGGCLGWWLMSCTFNSGRDR